MKKQLTALHCHLLHVNAHFIKNKSDAGPYRLRGVGAPEGGTGNCRVQVEPGQILDVCVSQRGQRLGSESPLSHPRSVGLQLAGSPPVSPDPWPLETK